jgi:serine/threonine protein kinase
VILTNHVSDIIHGDIKPSNVFIFQGRDGGDITARVSDFGYSTSLRHTKGIRLPYTIPWYAPEVHDRFFTFEAARRTDVYSFGMLCFWFLFHDAPNFPDPQKLVKMRKLRHDMRREAEDLLSRSTNLSDPTRKILAALFKITLPQDSEHRAENFSEILQLFGWQR